MEILSRVPLAPLTTLGLGGPAHRFARAQSEDDLVAATRAAREESLPLFILGGGSNLVVSDAGFAGFVVQVALRGVTEFAQSGRRVLSAGAGEDWDTLVAASVELGLAGLECLSGIPGSVGGTPVQNVGAYGQEVSSTISRVRALDLESLETRDLAPAECEFGYRQSVFNTTRRGRYAVTRVDFALAPGGAPAMGYREVQAKFEGHSAAPSLAEVREAVLEIRRSKSMVVSQEDPNSRSAGSFFKNPALPVATWEGLRDASGAPAPRFDAGPGLVKVPAAWLIEQAGFRRGEARGAVGISSRHTLALVTREGARTAELVALAQDIQGRVREKFGVELRPEPVFLGFDSPPLG